MDFGKWINGEYIVGDEMKDIFITVFAAIMLALYCSCLFYAKGFEKGYNQCAKEVRNERYGR